jgi:ribosomal protein S18 acetylase RimI-like enzyme
VTGPSEGDDPRPAAGAPRWELEELLQQVRRALAARDEDPTGTWVEESATDLASGTKSGWYLPGPEGGIVFYARRGPATFGHLHAVGGRAVARRLAGTLLANLPVDVASLDLGFTGLAPLDERALADGLAAAPGSTVIERQAMERPLTAADGRFPPDPPAGVDRLPVSAVTVEALVELDRLAFRGSTDALLLGNEPGAYRRALEAMLESRLGRFLGEASAALLEPEPTRLVGAVLTAERSSRRAIVLDLVVDPERRRRGLGRFLLGWTLRAVWALGYESARLWVSVRNEAAVELYRTFGFRTTLEATIYRWDRAASVAQPQTSR